MVNCKHCNCEIRGKPWITYKDTITKSDYCSYKCGKERPIYYNWDNVVNKEDFNYDLVPIIKRNKPYINNFSLLTDIEISELSEEEYNEYMDQLDEFKFNNPERYYQMCDIMNEYTDYDLIVDDDEINDGYSTDDCDMRYYQ